MENSALEAPAHRLLVVRDEHELHPARRRRGPGLQGHAAIGIDVLDREHRLLGPRSQEPIDPLDPSVVSARR
jgi:hypothetical protein